MKRMLWNGVLPVPFIRFEFGSFDLDAGECFYSGRDSSGLRTLIWKFLASFGLR